MKQELWQLVEPFDAVVFDCDGTLSRIEGIDVLAELAGVQSTVAVLTEEAMSVSGITPEIFGKRMSLVRPSLHQVVELGQQYYEHRIPDVCAVIDAFKIATKSVYIVSAGLNPAVKIFAALLGISEKNVFAVDVQFDEQGNYQNFNHEALTANQGGKRKILEELSTKHPRILFVGDGMNDVEARDVVDRFVGFGGYRFRDSILKHCDFYIKSPSFASLLPLGLTPEEISCLPQAFLNLAKQGVGQLESGEVLC